MIKIKKNILDLVPIKNEKNSWSVNENNFVVITILRNNILDKIVRKFCKTPDKFNIELDEFGSFVWDKIDGKKNIYEICRDMKNMFNNKVEPVYSRVIEFIKILRNNNLIKL